MNFMEILLQESFDPQHVKIFESPAKLCVKCSYILHISSVLFPLYFNQNQKKNYAAKYQGVLQSYNTWFKKKL